MTGSDDTRRESPRTRRVRDIVLAEGIRLLAEQGGGAVTALQISKGTGVARSTIYRHWPDQAALLLDVIERGVRPGHPTRISGDLPQDLQVVLRGLRDRLRIRNFRAVFATVLSQANTDPAFEEPQRRLVSGVLLPLREVLADAVERGAIAETLDVETASLLLAGPVLTQHVMLRSPASDALIEGIVARFLRGQEGA